MKAQTARDRINRLRSLRDVHRDSHVKNHSEYARGVYNGLEQAMAIMEDREAATVGSHGPSFERFGRWKLIFKDLTRPVWGIKPSTARRQE